MLVNMIVPVPSLCMPNMANFQLQVGIALRPPCVCFWQQKEVRLDHILKEANCALSERPPSSQGLFSRSPSFLHFQNSRCFVPCAVNPALGPMEGPEKFNFSQPIETVRNLWESCPEPVKSFPWKKVLLNYLHLIFGLVYEVAKYLCVPLLAISSLSEMSYCAHEKKMRLIPLPLLAGAVVAGILKDSIVEASHDLEEGDFPWHLLAIAVLFVLLKLLGPYYPYWGRIFVPHFANGGLWRVLWSTYVWYRRPQDPLKRVDIALGNNQSS